MARADHIHISDLQNIWKPNNWIKHTNNIFNFKFIFKQIFSNNIDNRPGIKIYCSDFFTLIGEHMTPGPPQAITRNPWHKI